MAIKEKEYEKLCGTTKPTLGTNGHDKLL